MDNTRGSTRMNPRVYKGDVMTQTWIDSRVLATLSVWLDTEGIMTRFLSEVMRETLEMVVANLVKDDKIEMVEDTDRAREILQRRYRINLNAKNKAGKEIGGKNIAHNQALSCRRVESGKVGGYNPTLESAEEIPVQSKDDEQPKNNRAIDNVDEGEIMKTMEKREDEAIRKRAKEEKEKILANADIDENGVVTPKGVPRGPIYEDEFNAFKEEERKKEKKERNEKEVDRIKRRIEKKKNKLDDLKEKENE